MKKSSLIYAILSVLLLGYAVYALVWTHSEWTNERCTGLRISIVDSIGHGFVTEQEIARELDPLTTTAKGMPLRNIDTDSIRTLLAGIDKIEHASVLLTAHDSIVVLVTPMHPVLRIWDRDHGSSYYINRDGKKISADARYHIDVPVAVGGFDSIITPASLLPLVDHITANPTWNSLITMIMIRNHNVYLLPAIRGHIINLGSISNLDNKFARLHTMYTEVLPVKGWDFYDTLSVKWDGQIVATRRHNKLAPAPFNFGDDSENEEGDAGTMSTEIDMHAAKKDNKQ
ncbi:MAG: hypothetical protein K2M76_00445 [Muribaculaceae bacterium]|nr:hypothetical protein [Muribaculaceae bacterium]